MTFRISTALVFLGCCLGATSIPAVAEEAGARLVLLNVRAGQLPPDTAFDDKTRPELVPEYKELGGQALKVAFAAGDAFGSRGGLNQNWKRFACLQFDAFNPAATPVNLVLNVLHARSTNFQTRAAVPIKLKPGKNAVKISVDEMVNGNGSAADLAHVNRWNISDADGKGPTVYFGDVSLEGGEAPPSPSAAAAGVGPSIGYKIVGQVGGMPAQFTATPFVVATPPAPAVAPVVGDPQRLARIRAAKAPTLDKPTQFDAPAADAVLAALEVFPPDNAWNLIVEDWPLHPNSKNIVASIGAEKPLRANSDMGFILIPPDQKKVDVKITDYAGESDRGPFPIPDETPIEGWPVGAGGQSLDDVQRNKRNEDADRHGIVVDPTNRMLYEFYHLRKTDAGWEAAQASVFDLKSNKLRPAEWTSTDAAGLPIFPSVVRYDELERGKVEHALRVTVVKSRRAFVHPARHFASALTDENLPRMGERLRLRKDFDVAGVSPEVQAILVALKRYGMFVADNGLDWATSVAPDPRIKSLHAELRKVKGSDFEVVQPPPGYQPPE